MSAELVKLRVKINKLNAELMNVLGRRMWLIPQVALCKKANGIKRYQPKREREIIASARKMAKKEGFNPDLAEGIMKLIIADAHRIEKKIIGR
jgi:chorismate mutase/prephenate dehydrogenase